VQVSVDIVEQVATTMMIIDLKNNSGSRQEAELLVPVPAGAAIRGFDFQGSGAEPSAELLPKDKAVATYESIVAKIKDPALLEFAGLNLIRSSVFPLDANGTQKISLTYEHLLPADGARVDYILPRTESIDYHVPWEVSIKIKSRKSLSTAYSPSHQIRFQRTANNSGVIRLGTDAMSEPGSLQLSYLLDLDGGVTASLVAYPDVRIDGGYFLLLAGLPVEAAAAQARGRASVRREVTLVIDRSGSMAGEKLEQAKAAAVQVIDGLYDGEAFNVIDYSDSIASFEVEPIVKSAANARQARHYVRQLTAAGGTNIHDALLEAVRPKPLNDMLPIVLFLTDGLPTIGVRSEVAIRNAVDKANKHKRRIFSFGVGYDVNAPLLNFLSRKSRAVSTYVLPGEEIEAKVSRIYRRLFGPVLSSPELVVVDPDDRVTTRRVLEPLPADLPDLFEGDQLVLLGKYKGDAPLRFRITGDFYGQKKTFQFKFKMNKATTKNSFVPRLWASRKIALLIDEIRQAGADSPGDPSVIAASAQNDPQIKELVDEIVRLSLDFGILTEYTAFLAREGTDLSARGEILRNTNENLIRRAQQVRHGIAAVNQAFNDNFQQLQKNENRRNFYFDEKMNRVQVTRVQQMNDRAFFQQGGRWIDGKAINSAAGVQTHDTVVVGTPEFSQLLHQLIDQNRQGVLAMSGEVLLHVDGRNVLVKGQ
jgi:Ca-activated chloride channel family protein